MSESYLERIASALIKEAGLPEPIREFRFHPVRRWRCDFVWIIGDDFNSKFDSFDSIHKPKKIILEIEGGIWLGNKGRHCNPAGYQKDLEKCNEAALLGFTVIRVTKAHMISGQMVEWLRRALDVDE